MAYITFNAVYRDGVFRPTEPLPVNLPASVQLTVSVPSSAPSWPVNVAEKYGALEAEKNKPSERDIGVRERAVELLRQRPFQSFRLVLSNGATFDICHPEKTWVSPFSILVGIPDPNSDAPGAILDSRLISLIDIAEIVPL